MTKIEKLTEEQEEGMISFREEWRKKGLSTESIDREKTKEVISSMYELIGKKKPIFIFCPSILFAQYQIAYCKIALPELLKKDSARIQLDKIKVEYITTSFWGQMDAYWIAFYEFPEKFLGVKYDKEKSDLLKLWSDLSKSCSWFWCYENYCFVSDRPKQLHFNSRNRLHKEDAPAIEWRDGWNLYFWNGIEVPEKWIMRKKEITKDDIIKEDNAEKRRCLREILGAKEYYNIISDGQGVTLLDEDTDNNGFPMKLYETTMQDDLISRKVQFIEVTCPSTNRVYNIYPPSQNCKNVWQAKADTFGKPVEKFKPVLET